MRHAPGANYNPPGVTFEPSKFIEGRTGSDASLRYAETSDFIDMAVGIRKGVSMRAGDRCPPFLVRNVLSALATDEYLFRVGRFLLVLGRLILMGYARTAFFQQFPAVTYPEAIGQFNEPHGINSFFSFP
jgi:hypothetical protein